ncbi:MULTISPECIES: TIGR04255 family protein [unclassified Sulfitobacter]|uniref:TIGR04255 family protein n=1 Tax=unclassified Sulfitobacter TaxID=196795 RepID=UPI0023E2B05D|nr:MULTISPECIES: TIGR04255 family protein [unclassified Sulfitobacter]MDF3381958.1 TIGR04255 family protein [Sulfitobacter sp. Ks11]MDF3385377.1 TIGR04255 family protein [Sulfitobacter sp. M85]MDF3388796.1 TIGR04255 family protein [Sulfitobacter sp. Ks16]MDF3399433.1 TIGR04255 family protein [Sulfitobacter sp. KE39]MDF3402854.1 TIGR04255 family protein [Sulfitobacter sp. Ks35]
MSQSNDYLYENAPLVEVVAEVRWDMVAIASMPGSEIDPLFERKHSAMQAAMAEVGFAFAERLVPDHVPNEMLAGQPIFRYRTAPNSWPLVQYGPGVFTVNITPPYDGWSEFRETLALAVNAFDSVLSLGSDFTNVRAADLRYIDAFTEMHGMNQFSTFLRDHLSVPMAPPQGLLASIGSPQADYVPRVEFSTQVGKRLDTRFVFHAASGTKDDTPAAILDLRARREFSEAKVAKSNELLTWFDEAHSILHSAFESTISDELRNRIGPARPIGSENGTRT